MKSEVSLHCCEKVRLIWVLMLNSITFTTLAPRFPILHLATHSCFRPEGCPSLKLEANTILFRDRNLNIADAALLGLKNTDLVVLSACQTAVSANSNVKNLPGWLIYLNGRGRGL